MTDTPISCVVDASIGIQLVVEEALSEQVEELFHHLTDNPPARLYVPDLFYLECANILWKYHQRYNYTRTQVEQGIALLRGLDVIVVPVTQILESAVHHSLLHHITAYDACYVAMAGEHSLPLVTADFRLLNTLQHSPIIAQTITDFLAVPLKPSAPSPQ